jgi:formate--tetrahydrofolate ligase
MNVDLEIAQKVTLRPIVDIANDLGLTQDDLELYGKYKAKLSFDTVNRLIQSDRPNGKIVLVTAITPTPAGEGKTTTTIGLTQALCKLGKKAISATREPSMGPVFGVKGGAAGGGYAQVLPMEDINLHFTGDMHAISAAHNLLSAMIDNHLQQGNALNIDSRQITWPRVLDMNDRALRFVNIGLGGRTNGVPRESKFSITVASEVMAILCLSNSLIELKERLGRIVIGRTEGKPAKPVTAADLKAQGAMAALLKDALKPNLVQTLEGTPAFVHGGPFANIAHGCSTVLSSHVARKLGEIVITEGGFGSDLGFEKYCDIVAPTAGLPPDAVVLVATIRALKMHGGVSKTKLTTENVAAVERGLKNLERHALNVEGRGAPFVISINHFTSDTDAETAAVRAFCQAHGWRVAFADVWGNGGAGGRELAEQVLDALNAPNHFEPVYTAEMSLPEKLNAVVQKVYGGEGVEFAPEAETQLKWLNENGFGSLRVCIAKTQYSFSDDPKGGGAPTGFKIRVRELRLSAGAGFVVALAGDIMTMPGLPEFPAAEAIDVDEHGQITGLF